jgi:glycosyltransferase involved in cell wall biosynthesis
MAETMSASTNALRILTLCYEFPPVGGGGGAVAKSIAERLAARGHKIRVVTGGMRHLPRQETRDGLAIYRTRACRRHEDRCTVFEMAAFLALAFGPMLRQIREWQPNVIHAHFAVPTGALAFAQSLFTKVPYVLTVHLGDVPGGFPEQTATLFRLIKPLTVPIWRCAAAISAVSGHVRNLAVAAYDVPVQTILNAVATAPSANATSEIHDPPHIVFAGRFVSQKNLPVLVDALAEIRARPWRATLIGDGPLLPELRKQIDAAGIRDRIALPRWQERSVVDKIMADADLFVIPSSAEGLPMAAVQALQHGLALVGSDIGGLRDVIIHERNGFLVPVGDAHALAQKLELLVDHPALLARMRAASRERSELFDLDRITTQYENLLRLAAARDKSATLPHVD